MATIFLKFEGSENKAFEKMCYELFCENYKQKQGIHSDINHKAIESNCIEIEGEIIGFQVKFYGPTIKLSHKEADLKTSINKIKELYPKVTKIHFYINKSFATGLLFSKSDKWLFSQLGQKPILDIQPSVKTLDI